MPNPSLFSRPSLESIQQSNIEDTQCGLNRLERAEDANGFPDRISAIADASEGLSLAFCPALTIQVESLKFERSVSADTWRA
jgi:hypothetical protein